MLRNFQKVKRINLDITKYKYKFIPLINTSNPNKLTLFSTIVNTIDVTSYLTFLSVNKYNLT